MPSLPLRRSALDTREDGVAGIESQELLPRAAVNACPIASGQSSGRSMCEHCLTSTSQHARDIIAPENRIDR